MTNIKRPIHLQLRPTSIPLAPATCSPRVALSPTGDALPSQILPHLFVGNQEQTNRDTLNRLNISYILSLGILPLISNNLSPTSPTTASATMVTSNSPNTTANNVCVANSTSASSLSSHHRNPRHQHYGHVRRQASRTSSNHHQININNQILLPSQNSSRDFKLRLRLSSSQGTSLIGQASECLLSPINVPGSPASIASHTSITGVRHRASITDRTADGENKGVKTVRYIQCKCINISDNSDQLLTRFFDEAHQFIDEARRKKCNILVHCLAGISRSPTIAIAYLMRVNSLRLQEAYNLVKQCRPQIDPNLSFMGQLMIYEKKLDEQRELQTNNCNNAIAAANVNGVGGMDYGL